MKLPGALTERIQKIHFFFEAGGGGGGGDMTPPWKVNKSPRFSGVLSQEVDKKINPR
jgi:hypothetical protein